MVVDAIGVAYGDTRSGAVCCKAERSRITSQGEGRSMKTRCRSPIAGTGNVSLYVYWVAVVATNPRIVASPPSREPTTIPVGTIAQASELTVPFVMRSASGSRKKMPFGIKKMFRKLS